MRFMCLAAVAALGILTPSATFGQASNLSITNYQFVSEQQTSLTSSNVTYRADVLNTGVALGSATATLSSLDPFSVRVVPGQETLKFAPVPANSQVTSSNTFTILVNRTVPFDFNKLRWTFQTTSAGPIANAGPNQIVKVGSTVTLNGSGSTNPSGVGTLTYSWAFTFRPAGTAAILMNPTSVMPSFVTDVVDTYVITLTVSNGVASDSASVTVSTTAAPPPVANAGPDQTVAVGSTVVLNGSGSTSGSGNPLTYAWTLKPPAGSNAALTGANTVAPTFVVDKAGTYMAQLIVKDGLASSAPSTVTISTSVVKPVANAGPAQIVNTGVLVQLNGSASTDANGLPLTYQWSLITLPPGSVAVLSSTTAVNPTFTADRPGTYVAQLIVNNGTLNSDAATVMITTQPPLAPTANAGTPQTVNVGSKVTLNGSGTDPQNLPLTFQWSLINKPLGSAATLSSTVIPNPTFIADLPGSYVAQLVVNNGFQSSPASTVTISTTCSQPVANPGPNQSVGLGSTVTLNGSGSGDVCHDPLTYAWTFTARPAGSAATLSGANTVSPTFVADVTGTYVVQLIVNNTFSSSVPVTVTITAAPDIILLANVTVQPGQQANFPVTLANPAPAGGVFINLSSSDTSKVTVSPSAVFIPQGSTVSNQPKVTGVSVGSATITASASGLTTASQVVQVTPGQTLSFQPPSLTINVGSTGNLTLNLSGAAQADLKINLSSSNPAAATVPATVTIFAGTAAVPVPVTAVGAGSTVIHASALPNIADTTANVTVQGPLSISVPATTAVGLGQSAPFAVTLSQAAPAGGVTVTLLSSDPSKVTVPASVSIAAGATTPATQPQVTGAGIGSATITASATGYTSGTGTVNVSATLNFTGSPLSVTVGSTGNLTLNLAGGQAPAGGLTVNLSSSDTSKATVPATVTFAAGATSVPVVVTGVAVGGPVTITASAAGFSNATATVNVTQQPTINVPGTTAVGLGLSVDFAVTLSAPAPAGGLTVTLLSSDPSKVTVPASVSIAAGATTPAVQPQVTGAGVGSATITASAAGYTSGTGTVTVSATLNFTGSPLSVTVGTTGNLTLNLVGGQAPAGGLTVNLSSNNTGVATVPATVTFAAGATSVPVPVTGVAVGGPVTITASAAGIPNATATVNVQTLPTISVPGTTAVGLGQSATFAVTLSMAAPAGGVTVTLTSSDPSKVTVPASVSIAAGATTPAVQPQVTGVGVGSATITASATGYTSGTGTVNVSATLNFTGSPLSVTMGSTGNLSLNLSGPAPAGGLTVNLSSNDTSKATVPATVTFAAGATSVPVPVTGVAVGGPVTITASATGIPNATATVNVTQQPTINVPGTTAVGLGQSATFAVTLSAPAPAGGLTVTLLSSDPSKVTVPASVSIAAGATTPAVQPQVTGAGVGSATITASATGYMSGTGTVNVSATMNFTGSPLSVTVGTTGNLTLNLAGGQAPAGGLTVNLSSSDTSKATVPATVTFAAGATSVPVVVTGVAVGGPVTITASAAGIPNATATVNVQAVPTINVPATTAVGLGQSAAFAVTLSVPAPAGGVTVTLTSSDPSKVTVPASVSIAAGATTPAVQPQVTGAGVGSATITASATGYASGAGTVNVSATMNFTGSPLSVTVGTTGSLTLNLAGGQAPAGGLIVNLSSSDTSKATVPATVTFAAGATSVPVPVTGVAAGGPVTITASATGIPNATATVNVQAPAAISVPASTAVGLGQSAVFAISLSVAAPAGGLTVTLLSSDPSKVTVPASVSIAAGATTPVVQPQVTGAGVGSATITASATGYASAAGTVNVPSPTLSFAGDLTINAGTSGNLTLNLVGGQAPAGGLIVNLASSNTGAATVAATVTFPAGATSVQVPVTGVAAGSATITASAPNITSGTANVTVNGVVGGPSIIVPGASVGQNLQTSITISISPAAPVGGLSIKVTSSDASKLLVAGRQTDLGTQQTTFVVPEGQSSVSGVYLQSLVNTGTVTITASAPSGSGYQSGVATITLTPSGFLMTGPGGATLTTSVGAAKSTLTLTPARLDSSLNFAENQQVRGGTTCVVPPTGPPCVPTVVFSVSVDITNSNPSAGTVGTPVSFAGGDGSATTLFTPGSAGSTTLTAVAPAGFSTPTSGNSVAVTVNPATLMPSNVTVGKNLETTTHVTGAASGLQINVTSNNPSLVLLACLDAASCTGTAPNGPGVASITVTVPSGQNTSPDFYVYGVADTGTATYTASANGFVSGTGTVTLAKSGFVIAGPGGISPGQTMVQSFVPFTSSTDINVFSAMLDASGNFVAMQAVADSLSVNVNVTSSNTNVGTISMSPVTINGGSFGATTQFIKGVGGSTDLTVSTPAGFSTPTAQYTKVTANVLKQGFVLSCNGVPIGQDLQTDCTVTIGQKGPADVSVTLTSNSGLLLLSTTATSLGAASIMVTIPSGSTSASYFAQALGSAGTVTYTVSANGFVTRTATQTLAPSGVIIVEPSGAIGQPFFSTTVSGGPVPVKVYTAVLNPADNSFQNTESLRGGIASVQVSLSSTNTGVGTIASPVTITSGSGSAVAQFTPKSQGSTTLLLATPAGFTASSNDFKLAVSVTP